MIAAFFLACSDALAPRQRRAFLASLGLAVLLFLGLWFGATALLQGGHLFGNAWLDAPLTVLGSLAALALCVVLFPALMTLVLGFFLDGVLVGLERRHYPSLPPPRALGLGKTLLMALRLLGLTIVANLIILPLYAVPGINLFIYYGLNGYLLGREYFELVALRRLDRAATRAMWRWYRGRLVLAGVVIALLLSLPLVNLVTPIVAAAFMLHVFEALRARASATMVRR
jgi:CysZ protein